jgi:hypothetical protein
VADLEQQTVNQQFTNRAEHGQPKKFQVDYSRLFPDDVKTLKDNPQYAFTLERRGIITGVEHVLSGSTYWGKDS